MPRHRPLLDSASVRLLRQLSSEAWEKLKASFARADLHRPLFDDKRFPTTGARHYFL